VILDFASYWKEIAVVLAALFAIASTIFEVKDKASHRITIWGRIFFGLTILSMIGGFYAQWEGNARDALRSKQSQDDMLKVIENTNRNVHDMSRILQPLGKSDIYFLFKPNCMELKEFCDAALKKAKDDKHPDNVASFSMPDVDWSKWPGSHYEEISLLFFKSKDLAKKHLEGSCLGCDDGDIYFSTDFDIGEMKPGSLPTVVISYSVTNEELLIGDFRTDILPGVNGDKILSIVDLPGSTLIIYASNRLLKKLTLITASIKTEHGQTIEIKDPILLNIKGQTLLEYVFSDSSQH
jgi:hypothetical protein